LEEALTIRNPFGIKSSISCFASKPGLAEAPRRMSQDLIPPAKELKIALKSLYNGLDILP